jgi:hypothetical protein
MKISVGVTHFHLENIINEEENYRRRTKIGEERIIVEERKCVETENSRHKIRKKVDLRINSIIYII